MTMFNFIYAFHMPLFVFISGKFSRFSNPQKYKKGILRLVETYVVFQCALCLTAYFMGEKLYWGMLTTPRFALWYLVALIYYRLFVYIANTRQFVKSFGLLLIVSIVVSIAAPVFSIGGHFAIKRAMTFTPYFVLGYFSDRIDLKKIIEKIPIWVSMIFLIVLFVALYVGLQYYDINLATIVHWSFVYGGEGASIYLTRVLWRVLFIPFSLLTAAMVLKLIRTVNRIDSLGNVSMFIFIYHMFAVYLLEFLVRHGYLIQNEVLLFLYSVIATVILVLMSKIKIFSILLNPITYFQKENKCGANK